MRQRTQSREIGTHSNGLIISARNYRRKHSSGAPPFPERAPAAQPTFADFALTTDGRVFDS